MELVLNDQVRRAQRAVRFGMGCGQGARRAVQIAILQVRRAEAVTAALFLDLTKEHLRRAIPGHLGKFVYRRDQQGRQAAIDLFIDDQDGQALAGGLAWTERALAQSIAAVDQGPPASGGEALDADIAPGLDARPAPGAVGKLARGADAANRASPI